MMFKRFSSAAVLVGTMLLLSAVAPAATLSFSGSDSGTTINGIVEETFDMAMNFTGLKFTISVEDDLGDITGFFFDTSNAGYMTFTLAGGQVSGVGFDDNKAPNNSNINPLGPFNLAIGIGAVGASDKGTPDFFPTTMITETSGSLMLSDLFGQNWGVRVQSTGTDREGSAKVGGVFPDEPDLPSPNIPEPSTYLLFGAGLAMVGILKRRKG